MKESPEEYAARKEREYEEFQEREREREENRYAKERLISRAESISSTSDFRSGADEMKELMDDWKSIGSAGRDNNDDLWSRFHSARQRFFDRRQQAWDERERIYSNNRSAKQRLVSQASTVANTNDFRAGIVQMRELMDDWKSTGPSGKESDEELWGQFQEARSKFFDRVNKDREKRDRERAANRTAKQRIVSKVASVSNTNDVRAGIEQMRELMNEWKSIGPSGKESDEELWGQFQDARSKFFDRANKERENRDRERALNRAAKQRLVSKAQGVANANDFKNGSQDMRELMDEWKSIGPSGKESDDELWAEFQGAQSKFRSAKTQDWEKRNREFEARADKKRRLISRANDLLRMSDNREARRLYAALQSEWKQVGSSGKQEQELWNEFSAVRDGLGQESLIPNRHNWRQRLSKTLDREIARENRRATTSITGGFKSFGQTGDTHRHHSDPKRYGGEPGQKLTPMDAGAHRAYHSDNAVWRQVTRPKGDRDSNVRNTADQYDMLRSKYPEAAKDFFTQHPEEEGKARQRNEERVDRVRSFRPKKET